MLTESTIARTARRVSFFITGVLIAMLTAWVVSDPRANLSTDWTAFDNAADRLFAGETIYRPWSDDEPLPYLYPPFALWLTMPLAVVGFYGSFLLSFGAAVLASVLAVRSLAELGGKAVDRRAAVTVALMNGFVVSSSLIGQYSGLWLLVMTISLSSWLRGREFVAGAALAILYIKPNLALPVLVLLIWSRSWRALGGNVAGLTALIVASIPFGIDRWRGFGDNMCAAADLQSLPGLDDVCADVDTTFIDVAPIDKMITVQSAVANTLGLETSDSMLTLVWLGCVALLGLAVLQLWRPSSLAASLPRAFAAAALFVVAANPRLYFYDGMLLILPGVVLWATGRKWLHDERLLLASWWIFAVLWVASWGGVIKALNVLTGPLAGILLILWSIDSVRRPDPRILGSEPSAEAVDFVGKSGSKA